MRHNLSIEGYLQEVTIPLRLSCVADSGWPAVLSLWYLYEDGALYCATPETARVVAYLTAEPRCAFEVAADQPPYCGVRGRSVAIIEPERGLEILERLLFRYLGGIDNPLATRLLSRSEPEVAIRLEPRSYHSWNFTSRMEQFADPSLQKLCPER